MPASNPSTYQPKNAPTPPEAINIVGHIIVRDPEHIVLANGEFLSPGHYQVVTGACYCMSEQQVQEMMEEEE